MEGFQGYWNFNLLYLLRIKAMSEFTLIIILFITFIIEIFRLQLKFRYKVPQSVSLFHSYPDTSITIFRYT